MKHFTKILCILLLAALLMPSNVFAAATSTDTEVVYFEDGSYMTVEVSSTEARASSTKTGTKTYIYNNSNGVEQWRAILSGTFTYNGSTSACGGCNCSVSIKNDNWYVISKTAAKSGCSATADLTMGRKLLDITVEKMPLSLTLTCDANGNLS